MPNLSPDAEPRTVLTPLPRFTQPLRDPDLPEVETGDPDPATEPARPPATATATETTPSNPRPPTASTDPTPGGRVPSLEAPTPTRTFSRAGDPKTAAEVIAGLLSLALGAAAWWAARRRLQFRQPTPGQLTDVATPLGNLAARHLPTEVINRDLVDATHAAGAMHRYLTDGPLLTRAPEPLPRGDDE